MQWKVMLALFGCWLWAPSQTAHAEIDAQSVQRAIERGVNYLRKTQTARGGWNEYGGQSCGLSALCTLAMANAGVKEEDPDFVRAMRYLRTFEPKQTYSVALQTLVFCHVGAVEDLPKIRRNVQWLVSEQNQEKSRFPGAWGYGGGRGSGDPSNAQFAILALGAAAERGVKVAPEVFELSAAYWKKQQLIQGGWSYGGNRPSGSMTCAGVGSLIICGDALADTSRGGRGEEIVDCCGADPKDESIEKGLTFLGKILSLQGNYGGRQLHYFYYLYAVERVGRLSGRRILGGRDWYREGAEQLVSLQDDFQGFWQGSGPVESTREIATAFAILFLSKGKRQVVVGRLDHPSLANSADANKSSDTKRLPHGGALRQLVRHVQRDWSKDLTWQTIDAESASVPDLLQSPVLVLSGRGRLNFSEQLVQRLGEYVDQGGTILFDASECEDPSAFEQSVARLCQQWYPTSRLEKLPISHPVWFAERSARPNDLGEDYWMYGVGACCRTPIFYSPKSLTCRWTYGGALFTRQKMKPTLQREVVAAVTLGENILAYATGRELKDKLDEATIVDGSQPPPPTRGAIPIAVGALGAGEKQVLNALPNAASMIRDRLVVEVIAVDEPIELSDESLARVGVLVLHGRTRFQLTQSARDALRRYLEREGILIATGICGSEVFASEIRKTLTELVPGSAFQTMPPEHPAFTPNYNGYDLSRVEIRRPSGQSGPLGEIRSGVAREPVRVNRRQGPPVIESMAVGEVDTVFFSPLDLSCALESQNSIQCPGYNTADAAKILSNLILYALNQ